METQNDPIRQIFLAGIGALAIGAEKSQEIIDQLVKKGQLTVEQGKEMSKDITSQAEESFGKVRDDIVAAHMKTMTKEQRDAFAARVAELAAQDDIDDELEKEESEEVEAAEEDDSGNVQG